MLKVVHTQSSPVVEEAHEYLYTYHLEAAGDERQQAMVLGSMFAGREMESSVRSHWMAYPSLKLACQRLQAIIGHQWRLADDAPPLIVECIEDATLEAMRAVQEDGLKANHVVAVYLSALADCAITACSYVTTGAKGKSRVRWTPLTMPIEVWALGNSDMEIRIEPGSKLSEAYRDGIKGQLLTHIATPTEVGMVMRNYF